MMIAPIAKAARDTKGTIGRAYGKAGVPHDSKQRIIHCLRVVNNNDSYDWEAILQQRFDQKNPV